MSFLFSEFIIQELYGFCNINNLLNATIQLKEYKKHFFYWILNSVYSLKYYNDTEFHNHINSRIHDGKKQLSIIISNNKNIKDVSCLGNCHTLNLQFCNEINYYVSHLGNVHTLNLSGCNKIIDENICNLGNITNLNLSGCNYITDYGIRHLGNVNTLDLSWCDKITNISFLGNIKILNLSVCNSITDVGLEILGNGNIQVLNLSHTNITDEGVKHLGKIHSLNISG